MSSSLAASARCAVAATAGSSAASTRWPSLWPSGISRTPADTQLAASACDAIERLKTIWGGPVAYPVAVATASAGHGIALEPALGAYLQALAANWVSAGVRLIPLGQSDGQRVLAVLEPAVAATAHRALGARLDDIGSSAFRADLASARHETQYTRLFRS